MINLKHYNAQLKKLSHHMTKLMPLGLNKFYQINVQITHLMFGQILFLFITGLLVPNLTNKGILHYTKEHKQNSQRNSHSIQLQRNK